MKQLLDRTLWLLLAIILSPIIIVVLIFFPWMLWTKKTAPKELIYQYKMNNY